MFIFDPRVPEHPVDETFIDQRLRPSRDNFYSIDSPVTIYAPRAYDNSRLVEVILHGEFPEGTVITVDGVEQKPSALIITPAALTIRISQQPTVTPAEQLLLGVGIVPTKVSGQKTEISTVEFKYEAGEIQE